MKRILLAAVAFAAIVGVPARAADMPVKAAPAPAPAIFDWSGWYIGGNAGWQHAEDRWAFDPTPVPAIVHAAYTVKGDGAIFGGQVGFNVQAGNWLWGVELTGSGGTHWNTENGFGNNFNLISQTRVTNIWTLGPRLGWVNGQWLVYGTGGGAAAEVSSRAVGVNGPFLDDRKWAEGWFAGGGIEYAVTRHWIIGAEYLFVSLGKKFECGRCPSGDAHDVWGREQIVRARLSYLFNSAR
jgi:outer membrane immunogenic protein